MTIQQVYDKLESIGLAEVTVYCQTTAADIYYRGSSENGRQPVRPEPIQILAIPYRVSGRIVGIHSSEADFLVLSYEGQAALFRQRADGLRLASNRIGEPTATNTRTMHVPVSAIKRITVGLS